MIALGAGRILMGVARSRLLWVLLAMDVALLALHMAMTGFDMMDTAPPSVDWARIDRDHSVSEAVETMLLLASAAVLTYKAAVASRPAILPIAAVLAFLAADNALLFHESASADLLPGHQNYGEALFFVLLFLASAAMTMVSWYFATMRERSYLVAIWFGIVVLGGFGVGVDALHVQAWKWFVEAERGIGIVEDLGELIAISLIAAISLRFLRDPLLAKRSAPAFGVDPALPQSRRGI